MLLVLDRKGKEGGGKREGDTGQGKREGTDGKRERGKGKVGEGVKEREKWKGKGVVKGEKGEGMR